MAGARFAEKVEVRLELPEEVARLLREVPQPIDAQLLEALLVDLFRRGEISSGYGAEVLGISRWDFWDLLKKHRVPIVEYTLEDWEQDRRAIEEYLAERGEPE